MSRPQVFEPQVIQLLQDHPEGMSRRDLAEAVGCSSQQIHKIVEKGKLPPTHRLFQPFVTVGKGEFGSDIVAFRPEDFDYSDESESSRPADSSRSAAPGVPDFGATLRVVGVLEEGGVVFVTLQGADGKRFRLRR